MEDKYWILILIGVIILASVIGAVVSSANYKHGLIEGYDKKICPIYVDNYYKGYNDCTEKYRERIDYCFEKCGGDYDILIVGGSDLYKTCMWNCFHPYNIVKIDLEK